MVILFFLSSCPLPNGFIFITPCFFGVAKLHFLKRIQVFLSSSIPLLVILVSNVVVVAVVIVLSQPERELATRR